jgi:hypothetical protein
MSLHPDIIEAMVAAGASPQVILAAYRAAWKSEHSQATHLYLVEIGDVESRPIKIGISANLDQRLPQLKSMRILTPKLLGYFTFDDREEARRVETAVCEHFPRCAKYGKISKEILNVTLEDALTFLVPLVGSRPFNRAECP